LSTPAYRIEERPASEAAFYAQACDPRRSVVVEACAGAGKTWMLVSRVLRALLEGFEPRQILAITFTRKAAGEMRQRLDEWLLTFSATRASAAERVQALQDRGLSSAEAQRLEPVLAGLHHTLLRGGRGVAMSTFHAWFAQLLAQAPLAVLEQLGLPPRHQLVEDITVLRQPLLTRLHRRVLADAGLRERYVALVRRHRRSTVLAWLDVAWQRGPEVARADAAGNAESSVPPALVLEPALAGLDHPGRLLRREPWRGDVAALAQLLARERNATPRNAAVQLEAALAQPDPQVALDTAVDALITQDGKPRRYMGSDPLLAVVIAHLQHLQALQRQQLAHVDHADLLALTRVLLAEYQALKQQRQLVDMPDLERAAERLLGDSTLAGWLQERLDQQLRLVLIDEFQDTSPLQWQVLQGWLGAYAGAGGGASGREPPSLFIVGDPKQSIYRFRGAEPRVFEAAARFVREGMGGTLLSCDHTRRNAPAVIEAVNTVFSEAQRDEGWGPFRAHTTGSAEAGHVRRLPGVERAAAVPAVKGAEPRWRDSLTEPRAEPEARLRALEAAQLGQAVVALLHGEGMAPGDVMVLARRRSMLALVAQALAARGVPHAVAEPLRLHESPEVLDLAAVLDVLVSPGHDLSLARALKSPLFGAADADLLHLATAARSMRQPWLDGLFAGAAGGSPALQRAALLLQGWLQALHTLTPHELLDRIVYEGELLQRVSAALPEAQRASALHAVQAFVGASLHHEGGRLASSYGLLRALRAGRLQAHAAAPVGAVQLLTVHGAKGLEARAVVLADCDPERQQAGRASVLVDWPVDASAPRRVAFVRNEAALAPTLQGAWQEQQQAMEREEINGLYVATTRAREWLVFSRTEPYGVGKQRSWWARVQAVAEPWVPVAGVVAAPDRAEVQVPVLPALHTALAAPGGTNEPTRDERTARLGTAVHRVLEWGGADLAAASRAAAREAGLPAHEAPAVQAIASRVVASPACARFFTGPQIRWAGNEVPLAWQGSLLRIDRLVALADGPGAATWWVLDYKLSHDPRGQPALREQLARYVAAVQALQPGERVRGAFITGSGEAVEL
jgi:ATP-dependent helicase/nuclease subunit A